MLKFRGNWRIYQRRILDNLEFHLQDDKLHIVAAPGAGKTTLGIEVIARLERPSLILCPTNTIKNQWKDRICSAFLEPYDYDKVSTDIKKPAYLTIITYQALLAAFCEGKKAFDNDIAQEDADYNFDEENETGNDSIKSSARFNSKKADTIIKLLSDAKISLLCFDEAHHLRKEWWKALMYLVENLKPEQTLALTATPPYDVDYNEWQRYEQLCGPIDEIISIPELVQNNDLCPHQDFIHFSLLKESENILIKKHISNIENIIKKITEDNDLIDYLKKQSFWTPNEDDIEKIYDNPDFYVSVASLLKSCNRSVSKEFLDLFNAKEIELPVFNTQQAKYFLNGLLITDRQYFANIDDKIEDYLNLSKKFGFVQNKRIELGENSKIQKQIANSIGKLDSISEIVELEAQALGNSLRMVILADYIKANDSDNSHLGVIPIWRTLKNKFDKKLSLGVLCGSLIILPKELEENLYRLMSDNNMAFDNITISQYKNEVDYITVIPKESAKNSIVSLITQLFNNGNLTVLVGTQALLGEGWDAPSINSLILSSTVSSYMLSNQMRGRAIRIDKNNPEKVSNIWHLATIHIANLQNYSENTKFTQTKDNIFPKKFSLGLYDYYQLKKRFEGYEAPSYYNKNEITNGIERIFPNGFNIEDTEVNEKDFLELNKNTLQFAQNRTQTKKLWEDALFSGYNKRAMEMRNGVDTPRITAKSLTYSGYKQSLFSTACAFITILFYLFYTRLISFNILLIWFIAFGLFEGSILLKFLKTGSVSSIIKQIAIVNLQTLSALGLIHTSIQNVGIKVDDTVQNLFLSCKNLQIEDNNLLIKCMQEFFDPIENPRYILIKENKILGITKQTDYFAIPSVISTNKKDIDIFKKLWQKHIGSCEIIYTRNKQGRKLLLKARDSAFSSSKRKKSKKLTKWQ